jgi:4-hydroxy-tetrahydrodipicolinate reductase
MSKLKNKKIEVVLVGASGRMGSAIGVEISLNKKFSPFLAITRSKPLDGFLHSSPQITTTQIENADVVIDFSLPELTVEVANVCAKAGVPLVSGVTGQSNEGRAALQKASKKIPVMWAANMSIGINMFLILIEQLGPISNWDFHLHEIHHNQKKDAPSGTAKVLHAKLTEVVGKKLPDATSTRGGGVFGDHTLLALSDSEVLKIEHRALNRQVFAQGALKAAKWILDKKPGLYSMGDVLRSMK